MNNVSVKKILFLAANPKDSARLRLSDEVREVAEGLTRSKKRENFQLEQRWAVRPRDVQRAILTLAPQFVHFSGHGQDSDGLIMEDEQGKSQLVSAKALASLFELFSNQVECVLFNACYSEVQADAVAQYIPYVIGMRQAIGDKAAREFAVGFYDALGEGYGIQFAYQAGRTSILMAGIPENLTPILKKGKNFKPVQLIFQEQGETSQDCYQAESSRTPMNLDDLDGQVPLDSEFYVERPPIENNCYRAIGRPGALIRIRAPQQFGKSSLLIRILDYAQEKYQYQATWLKLKGRVGTQDLLDLDSFLKWLCAQISRNLKLKDSVEEYWQDSRSGNDNCTYYLEDCLLDKSDAPLVLCLDEIDDLFKYDAIAGDFLGLLRAWHEESKINPLWQKLRLVITHSQEVYIPIDVNKSPFNVGLAIELIPFNCLQVEDLIRRYGLSWSQNEVDELINLTGGHPYLIRAALNYIVQGQFTLEQVLHAALTQEGFYRDYLHRQLRNLQQYPNLMTAMKQILVEEHPVRLNATEASKLAYMGLVRFHGNDVVPLCNLYRQCFRAMLEVSR